MRFIWEHYWLNPDPVVGLFTAFGAIVTALAVTYSVKAVKEAIELNIRDWIFFAVRSPL
ncbi:hypothetical protein NTD78_RS22650 [Enterobacter bugandensis]